MKRAAIVAGLLITACRSRASSDECAAMRERYLSLVMAEAGDPAALTPEQQAAVREVKMAMRDGEKGWKKVRDRCEAEVTKDQADCALAAKTPDAWEKCVTP